MMQKVKTFLTNLMLSVFLSTALLIIRYSTTVELYLFNIFGFILLIPVCYYIWYISENKIYEFSHMIQHEFYALPNKPQEENIYNQFIKLMVTILTLISTILTIYLIHIMFIYASIVVIWLSFISLLMVAIYLITYAYENYKKEIYKSYRLHD